MLSDSESDSFQKPVRAGCVHVFPDEEPSSQSRFDHYNAVSSSAFNTPRNMFVRSSSACLTYRIPSGRQPSSFSSTARSDEPLNSLSPAPTDTSLLVGKDPDDEPLLTNQPVQLAGGSGGERVESVRISESHTEIFCNPAGPETPARAEKAGVAIRAGDLETDERCEPGTVSDRSKNSNPVAPSPYRNSPGGRTSSSDVSAVDQERSPALISSGPSILGLSLSPGVQTAVARAREAGRLEGTDASVGGGESQAGSRVFPQPECGGVLGRGPFAEREAQTLGSGAASLSSRSPLGELPSAKSVGGGLSVAAAGPASCPPFHTETTSRVSSTQSIDCGTVGLGKPENADGVTEDGALKSSDGESQKEKPDGEADNGLEQERREDVRAEERAKGKTEDLWMVNEGQSYCLVASGAHSEEEGDIQNTRERLALSADVRSEVRRLQRALDRLKTETTVSVRESREAFRLRYATLLGARFRFTPRVRPPHGNGGARSVVTIPLGSRVQSSLLRTGRAQPTATKERGPGDSSLLSSFQWLYSPHFSAAASASWASTAFFSPLFRKRQSLLGLREADSLE